MTSSDVIEPGDLIYLRPANFPIHNSAHKIGTPNGCWEDLDEGGFITIVAVNPATSPDDPSRLSRGTQVWFVFRGKTYTQSRGWVEDRCAVSVSKRSGTRQ